MTTYVIEQGEAIFSGETSLVVALQEAHRSSPQVSLTVYDSSNNNTSLVSVFVKRVSGSSITIETSAPLTGKVFYRAISAV